MHISDLDVARAAHCQTGAALGKAGQRFHDGEPTTHEDAVHPLAAHIQHRKATAWRKAAERAGNARARQANRLGD